MIPARRFTAAVQLRLYQQGADTARGQLHRANHRGTQGVPRERLGMWVTFGVTLGSSAVNGRIVFPLMNRPITRPGEPSSAQADKHTHSPSHEQREVCYLHVIEREFFPLFEQTPVSQRMHPIKGAGKENWGGKNANIQRQKERHVDPSSVK